MFCFSYSFVFLYNLPDLEGMARGVKVSMGAEMDILRVSLR